VKGVSLRDRKEAVRSYSTYLQLSEFSGAFAALALVLLSS
jgi:hypothetical protein